MALDLSKFTEAQNKASNPTFTKNGVPSVGWGSIPQINSHSYKERSMDAIYSRLEAKSHNLGKRAQLISDPVSIIQEQKTYVEALHEQLGTIRDFYYNLIKPARGIPDIQKYDWAADQAAKLIEILDEISSLITPVSVDETIARNSNLTYNTYATVEKEGMNNSKKEFNQKKYDEKRAYKASLPK